LQGQSLREDFGLTPAEAALAFEILKADGLKAAANRLHISLATAHTHLAHVFDKTGARRQAELVRLILQG
jgi:DNA-binding CsgD family transcriptional regulator